MSNFSFPHNDFYPFGERSAIQNSKFSSANSFSSEESKCVIWERVNTEEIGSTKGKPLENIAETGENNCDKILPFYSNSKNVFVAF